MPHPKKDLPRGTLRSIDQIVTDRANKGAVLFVAKVKVREARSVRINVTFREDLLEKIDEQVARQRTTMMTGRLSFLPKLNPTYLVLFSRV